MHQALIKYFNSQANTPLSEDDVMTIESTFIPKKLRKRQYLLQEGEVCKHTAFIVRGAMRQYSVDDKGEEHITRLYIENWWATDRESLMKQTPSTYFIDTWEDTECLLITGAAFTDLINRIPTLSEWLRNVDLNFAIAAQRRLNAAISLSTEERFLDLEKSYPEFLQRFPQHIIASYLGVNRETLSRIRTRGVKK
ncbi:MAG TPA: Crp/Fnr family transcriptional regulator [Puia sp.]|jgi:CRP-like cAMP-binding protein|nr:Crp/Fnr family transcriptional regulator [Puia sp.]